MTSCITIIKQRCCPPRRHDQKPVFVSPFDFDNLDLKAKERVILVAAEQRNDFRVFMDYFRRYLSSPRGKIDKAFILKVEKIISDKHDYYDTLCFRSEFKDILQRSHSDVSSKPTPQSNTAHDRRIECLFRLRFDQTRENTVLPDIERQNLKRLVEESITAEIQQEAYSPSSFEDTTIP